MRSVLVLTSLSLALAGCAASIGDSCTTNVECSPQGDRICDTAQVGGYCTVQGCGPQSCPDDAVCVRFYPAGFLSTPCDPRREDAVDPALDPTDDCRPDELCLSSGLCALRAQESRFCMKPCEEDGDCRDGYECRRTGTAGAEAVIDPEDPDADAARFCAQK